MLMHQAKPCVGIRWVLRNGKRKESLKRRSEVEGDYYALVCPEHYFIFSLNLSKSCSRLGESPTQHWEAGLGMPGQGQTVGANNAHAAQPAPSCHGSVYVFSFFSSSPSLFHQRERLCSSLALEGSAAHAGIRWRRVFLHINVAKMRCCFPHQSRYHTVCRPSVHVSKSINWVFRI